ncbi:MoxR family ATPase [Candidatus Woesearchaeota archaeon]|nr:MoxR family ATPase [Candidatus Woesearchaeota archaeon]
MKEPSKSIIKKCKEDLDEVRGEVANVVVGQEKIVGSLLKALLANGHVLVEGIPGIAKTLVIKTLAMATGCKFKRIQFTPDLLPTDIVGITSYEENKGFFVIKGPIFSNFVLADEINRAPPKVQSALLEAMQEKQATIGKETFPMDLPFFVLATQNPIETLGTYTLPEAQIDRFLFKAEMTYPSKEEEKKIIEQNITIRNFEDFKIKPVLSQKRILEMQDLTKQIAHSEKIKEYIVDIANSTRYPEKYNIKTGKYIELGTSPRACISLFIGAKADALMRGDAYIRPQHVKNVAYEVLRHRIILNYTGQAEAIKMEDIISEILSKVPIP